MPPRKQTAKTTAKKKTARKPAPAADARTRLVEAALKRLARTPWDEVTLAGLARSAKIPVAELRAICGSKAALLGLMLDWNAARVTTTYEAEPGSAHDRLFEVAMCWFEVLEPHKKAVAALYDGLKYDPFTLLAARRQITATAQWLLTLAEADSGPALPLRAFGLAVALGRATPAWLADGPDLTKTMARLDMDLRRGETVLARFASDEDADGA